MIAYDRKRGVVLVMHAWKNFNGTVSFVGRRSRNVFLGRIGRQSDLYTSCSPTNSFWCTSLFLSLSFSFHGLFHDRRTGIHRSLPIRNMEIKCRNFVGFVVRVNLGLNRRSCVVEYVFDRFSLGYVPFVGIGIAYSRIESILLRNIHSVNVRVT